MNPLLILTLLLAGAPVRADQLGMLLVEGAGIGSEFQAAGHIALYGSHICPDGNAVRLRLCHEGEEGTAISKYGGESAERYEWLALPLSMYIQGETAPRNAPLIANGKIKRLIEERAFDTYFRGTLAPAPDGGLPKGNWTDDVGQALRRDAYLLTFEASREDTLRVIAGQKNAPGTSNYNLFGANCADHVTEALKPWIPTLGKRFDDFAMTTPIGIVQQMVSYAREHTELGLRIRKLSQTPGTFERSVDNIHPLQHAYKVPIWLFVTVWLRPEMTLGAMAYYELLDRFSMDAEFRNYATDTLAANTYERERMFARTDELRARMEEAQRGNDLRRYLALHAEHGAAVERGKELSRARKAELAVTVGLKADWKSYEREIGALVSRALSTRSLPAAIAREARRNSGDALLRLFDRDGSFAWDGDAIRMTLDGRSVRLTRGELLSGDPALAFSVALARVRYQMDAEAKNREPLADFRVDWALLEAALDRL